MTKGWTSSGRRACVGATFVVTLLAAWSAAPVSAEVLGVEIERRETFADGASFGLAGSYEKLVGQVHFALDPEDEGNQGIVDLELAPRESDGRVHFRSDVYVLQPADPARRSGTLFFEVPNRGGKAIFRYFQRGAVGTLDPSTREHAGDGFLLRQGLTLVWLGWQWDVPDQAGLLRLHAVFAQADPPLEGLVRADGVLSEDSPDFALAHRGHRGYGVADPDDLRNTLTVRDARLTERIVIPRSRWQFAHADERGEPVEDPRSIFLEGGFEKGRIYEAVYVAQRPAVVGLGFAAMRDFAAYCKNDPQSPVRGSRALVMGISQTGRFLRTFLYQGFNRTLRGQRAFDGVLIHTAGGGRGSFNHRFAQPSRDAHPFSAFFYPTDLFPFTDRAQTDPVSGIRDGLLENDSVDPATLPRVFMTNTGYEYWGRAAGLIHTTVDGSADVEPLPGVRLYHLASSQHFVDPFPPQPNEAVHAGNPADFLFVLRALLVALERWVVDGGEPPASRIPRIAEETLVRLDRYNFPELPGVRIPGRAHQAYRVDYGPRFRTEGMVAREPPEVGAAFPTLVPQVDEDGNELGGIRLPEIEVPLATYTSWNWRAPSIGAPDELADFRGSFLPLAKDATTRRDTGDPRPSLEERYPDFDTYLGRYAGASRSLVDQGFLLGEDLPELLERAESLWSLVSGQAVAQRHP